MIGGNLVELGDVVHDPVQLLHQAIDLVVAYGQLGQAGHVQHLVASDAHALSHSRSRPA
jgi:hypothetical protein